MINNKLLIIGAGVYGWVAKEIAESMSFFNEIAFVDDYSKIAADGSNVIGTTAELNNLINEHTSIIVAIGNPDIRLNLIDQLINLPCKLATLISPSAHISPTAKIDIGCIVEPMAVIHTGCKIKKGCIVSAGAVINHCSVLGNGVHVDCNATVYGNTTVPDRTKVFSGQVFKQ